MRSQVESAWLRRVKPAAAGQTVVCFPHAGGTAGYFSGWARHVGGAVGLAVVQYPGRADRAGEPFVEDIAVLADRVAEAVAALRHTVVLFGHSLGAAIAHEVATRLQRTGDLGGLAVSAHAGPDDLMEVTDHLLPDDELWESLRKLNGTHDAVIGERQFRSLVLPILRSDFRLAASYQPRSHRPLSVPVLACVGDEDPEVTPEQMMSWRRVTSAGFTLRTFPGGDHFYLNAAAPAVVRGVLGLLPEPRWPSMP